MRTSHLLLACATLFTDVAAFAHHSMAMFDMDQRITLAGTVRLFQWTNPHCYIQLLVPDKQGHQEEWSLEMTGPIYLQQLGLLPASLKPGDKVTVTVSPLRKMPAHKSGLVREIVGADGKQIGKPVSKQTGQPR